MKKFFLRATLALALPMLLFCPNTLLVHATELPSAEQQYTTGANKVPYSDRVRRSEMTDKEIEAYRVYDTFSIPEWQQLSPSEIENFTQNLVKREKTQTGFRHILDYHDYNYLKGKTYTSWERTGKKHEGVLECVKQNNFVQINNPNYEYYDELSKTMINYYDWREFDPDTAETDWYWEVVEKYDFWIYHGSNPFYIYTSQEAVDEYLKNAREGFVNNPDAELQFLDELLIVYPYSWGTKEENASINKPVDQSSEWGTITVYGYMDEEILKADNSEASACVVFKNTETNDIYTAELLYWYDYTTSINVPIGTYIVSSGFIDDRYPFSLSEEDKAWNEGVYVGYLENESVRAEFGTPVLKEEINASVEEEEEVVTEEVPEIQPEESNPIIEKIILISIFALLGIAIIVVGIVLYKKHKDLNQIQ